MAQTPEIPLLAIKDLTVEFKTRAGIVEALHQVGFDVRKREMVGVVGESGSGKSPPTQSWAFLTGPGGRRRARQCSAASR